MPTEVSFVRLYDNVEVPEYKTEGSAAFDLAVCEDVIIPINATVKAHTGLVIGAPEGTFLMVVPRSSTYHRYSLRISNTPGIVDSDFCGPDDEMMLSLHNMGDTAVTIPRGTRLAQGIIIPFVRAMFQEVDVIRGDSRGGWGSTGV